MIKIKPIMKKNILGIHPKILINLNKHSIINYEFFFHNIVNMKINIFIF